MRAGSSRMLAASVPALMVNVDAKAAQALAHEAQVHRLLLPQLLQLRRLQQGQQEAAHVLRFQQRSRSRRQVAVDAQHSRRAGDQQHVGGVPAGRESKQVIERRRGLRPSRRRLLAGRRAVQLSHDLRKFSVVFAHDPALPFSH
jgi:hypothetical protein